jgi:hypothetical protein
MVREFADTSLGVPLEYQEPRLCLQSLSVCRIDDPALVGNAKHYFDRFFGEIVSKFHVQNPNRLSTG